MKTTPKDFFLHLGTMVTLYAVAISLINLVFKIINAVFPNEIFYRNYGYNDFSPISWHVATLIIVFPIFILLSWFLAREYKVMPEKKTLGVRKWLIYITLFVSGIVIAGDFVFLLYSFLSGEIITAGFVLKAIALFIIAGAIFLYYISNLREKVTPARDRIYAIISAIVILAVIAWGFYIFGSPLTQRKLRADSVRVNDLQNIQWQVVNYWQQKEILPENLGALSDTISGFVAPRDVETGEPYGYRVISETDFELCANFNLASKESRKFVEVYPPELGLSDLERNNWTHEAGRTCFERNIDPELYSPAPARKF